MSTNTITALTTLVVALAGLAAAITAAYKAVKAETATAIVSQQVHAVDAKVDGHLSTLTQAVVNSAVNSTPIDRATVQALVDRSNQVTGLAITVPDVPTVSVPIATPIIVMPEPPHTKEGNP